MADRLIELAESVLDRVYTYGYQHRAAEDKQRKAEDELKAADEALRIALKDRDHWRESRRQAIEAGELMQAEIETLRVDRDHWRGIAESYAIPPKQCEDNAELERLREFVGKMREAKQRWHHDKHFSPINYVDYCNLALDELDATNPAPVTEPMGGGE